MIQRFLVLASFAALLTLGLPAPVDAYGAAHVGYTHVGPNGVYHTGTTAAAGPGGAYSTGHTSAAGYGGGAYHTGYSAGATTGGAYHYGSGGTVYAPSTANYGYIR